ncbi:HesB/YadR/YfhF family protein [Pallidibacillus pasinlerensis]|uniref:HesB/YadR/YfhF family protein n=1 Tax=Pallidibacillus pasinlerensis TaxID=2703818 RepID=A0ABX0A6Q9_9BACI|nr:HesB/YadR/YfhF family protein [Pallidibacillus pasinlerensis]NCU18216.1 HesB/YadR/YfhF family protein [Pallidibacillus pasinlerensis]
MKIEVSDAAIKWFKEEMGLENGDKIKFYSQIYGTSPVQPGYALGFTKDNSPLDMAAHTEKDGLVFYVEERDLWFFDGHDLFVDYNEEQDELVYNYTKSE